MISLCIGKISTILIQDKGAGWSVKVQDQRYIKAKKEGEKNKGFTNVTISLQIWFE